MAVPSLRHNCANAMALLCHSIGTTDESLILAPTGSIIIGKTKSTNFQNEKYKKGMSFKYYINGA